MSTSADQRSGLRAGIIVTGTEVLNGTIRDRNGPWLSGRLADLGFEVAQITVTGDRHSDLRSALEAMRALGVELIVTSGGLGPTADDLTGEVVAQFAGRELLLDPAMESQIGEILTRFARNRPDMDREALMAANRKQAMVPDGAIALDPAGTAPGLVVPVDDGPLVVVLPGPPRELQPIWEAALATEPVRALLDRTPPIRHRVLRLYGVPESAIASTLVEIERGGVDLAPLEITTCLRRGELEIEVRHRPGAESQLEALIGGIDERHGERVFSHDGTTIDEQLAELLAGHRLALGESCTAGLLAARITDRPGSSAYFAGGAVVYSNEAKTDLLGVPATMIDRHGAVSPEVARALADGARDRFAADLGVGITGIAGPDGGTDEKPVGLVCLCVTSSAGAVSEREVVLSGGRQDVRERAALAAMHMLRALLLGRSAP